MDGFIKNKLYNSWRAFRYTKKGKKIGNEPKWDEFINFYNDVHSYYEEGKRFCRIDFNKPYSNDNFRFLTNKEISNSKSNTTRLTYKGECKTIRDWCNELDLYYPAVRQRFFNTKGYLAEEILFGRINNTRKKIKCQHELDYQEKRNKASKMISTYRCRDKKRGMDCDLDTEWFIENIFNKECFYCGDTSKLGADRMDNSFGHIKNNVVACCYTCNVAKSDNFSVDEMKVLGKTIAEIKSNRAEP